jgi:hypothetical protein
MAPIATGIVVMLQAAANVAMFSLKLFYLKEGSSLHKK